jgi:pantoate--beta-alanine ligase
MSNPQIFLPKMRVIKSISEMQRVSNEYRHQGREIAFVPTMGYLHEGHLSLIRIAREKAEIVVVSIFINPTQFGPGEDLERYPQDFARDEKLCAQENVDIVFYPDKTEMYSDTFKTYVISVDLSEKLCGISRPAHFRGVTTIVTKLFNIIQPDFAVFGQKDAQQALIIRRMSMDLNFNIKIIIAPIIREPDGLAMSSRNKYLNREERKEAAALSKSLKLAKSMINQGEHKADAIKSEMYNMLAGYKKVQLEYLEIVDYDTLNPVEIVNNNVLIAIAANIGNTRLIDNVLI